MEEVLGRLSRLLTPRERARVARAAGELGDDADGQAAFAEYVMQIVRGDPRRFRPLLSNADFAGAVVRDDFDPAQVLLRLCVEALGGADAAARLRQSNNNPLLVTAVGRTNVPAVRHLLELGADARAPDTNRCDSVYYASVAQGLHLATGTDADYVQILRWFRDNEWHAERRCDVRECVAEGRSIPSLGVAALHPSGNMKVVDFLIDECGADVNAEVSPIGETPLHRACEGGNLLIVRKLLKAGANTRARMRNLLPDGNPSGTLPIEMVLQNHNLRIAVCIFQHEEALGMGEDFVDDVPPVPEGRIHSSQVNLVALRNLVKGYLEGGSATMDDVTVFDARQHRPEEMPEHRDDIAERRTAVRDAVAGKTRRTCHNAGCGKANFEMQACGSCRAVFYCNRRCQTADWRARHKAECRSPAQPKGVL